MTTIRTPHYAGHNNRTGRYERTYTDGTVEADPRPDVQEVIKTEALSDARLFVDEHGEALDPDLTDWDVQAWEMADVYRRLSSDEKESGFRLYQATLVAETQRLAEEEV